MKRRHKVTIGVLVVVAAIVYLVISGFGGNTGYQATISQLVADTGQMEGRYVLAEATLVPESAQWDAQKIELRFKATDGKTEIPVLLNDVAPDNFYNPEAQLILKGQLKGGVFLADKVETRCPSKYEALEQEQSAKQ